MGTIQRPKQEGNSLGSLQHQSTTTAGYKNGSSPRLRVTLQVYSHGAKQPTMDGCRLWINRGIFLLWAWYVISRTSWSVRWKYCSVLGDTCTAGALYLTLRICLFLFRRSSTIFFLSRLDRSCRKAILPVELASKLLSKPCVRPSDARCNILQQ